MRNKDGNYFSNRPTRVGTRLSASPDPEEEATKNVDRMPRGNLGAKHGMYVSLKADYFEDVMHQGVEY